MSYYTDSELLDILLDEYECEDEHEAMGLFALGSTVPGACALCGAVSDSMEPDQSAGWCHECGSYEVVAITVLMGLC